MTHKKLNFIKISKNIKIKWDEQMKRILTLLIVIIPTLAGCWSSREISDIAIVLGVALDKAKDENLRMTLQLAVPKKSETTSGSQSSSTQSTMMVSAEGSSIMEAYQIMQKKLSREIFFAHNRIIIIGDKLASEGISSILDFFSRQRQSHLRQYLLFTTEEAANILESGSQFEWALAEELRKKEKTGIGVGVRIREFWGKMLNDREEPIADKVANLHIIEGEKKKQETSNPPKTPSITGVAVFREDRLIGWLNDKEACGILWLRNELDSGVLETSISRKKGGGRVGGRMWNVSTKIKPIFLNEKLRIRIEIWGDIEIFENSSKVNLGNPLTINTLQLMFEKEVKSKLQLTLNKAQKKLKSDIFGFGQAVYQTNPKKWEIYYKKRWHEIYPHIEVEINPHITVQGTGFTTKPMLLPNAKK